MSTVQITNHTARAWRGVVVKLHLLPEEARTAQLATYDRGIAELVEQMLPQVEAMVERYGKRLGPRVFLETMTIPGPRRPLDAEVKA